MRIALLLAWFAGFPAAAFAQAAIAGIVRDPSGAPVPGAQVAVTGPALIEKVRTATTDAAGQYRVEDLRPGPYRVTISLVGFSPVQRERVELAGSFTATVDADLPIGPLAESVIVSAAVSAVDIRSPKRESILTGDAVAALPTVRSYNSLLVLVPGITTNVNDVVTGPATASFPVHGGRANEGRLMVDGLTIGSPPNGNSATTYVFDVGKSEEVAVTTSGALGEEETAGPVMHIMPRAGGNMTSGSFLASGTGGALQSDNVTSELRAQNVAAATPLTRVYDLSATFGGPVMKNRLWFFVNAHTGDSTKESATVYYNVNAGDPMKWLYAPDASRREYSDRAFENASARLTWQMSPRSRLSAFWDEQRLCRTCTGATPGLAEPQQVAPEAVGVLGRPLRVTQAKWWSPVTSRLLFDVAYGGTWFGVGNFERSPNPTRDLIRVAEQCASGCAANGGIPGLVYRSQDFSDAHTGSYLWKASASYITGTHSLKAGYQHTLMTDDRTWFTNDHNLTYRFSNGVPNQLTQSISPWVNNARVAWDGLFVQEQWSGRRLTLQGAVRFDRARSWFPQQQEGPSRFLPTPIVIPETRGVDSYTDITPRLGAVYDLSGSGKTALKVSFGRYLEGAGVTGNYANTNPTLRMPQTTSTFGTAGVTRAWTDANGNLVPDCDLLNPSAQDLRARGGDLCGVLSNTSFGRNVLTNNFDASILSGWGVRPSDWNLDISFEQQLRAQSSVRVDYVRRWYRGFAVADNLALQPSDLTPFSINAPVDARLPGGGGYVVSGLYDVVPEKAGQVSNRVTDAIGYGAWSQYFNGVDVTFSTRAGRSFVVSGGTSTGQTVADNCQVRAQLPELATTTTGTSAFGPGLATSAVTPASPYCHVAFGLLTQFRGLTSYIVPKAELQLSAVFQSKPGAMLAANYAVPNAAAAPSLGRNLSGNAPNVTVNLVAPGTMFGDRLNQLDLRAARTFKSGRLRTTIGLDVYNALNSSAVLTYNNAFVPGGTWLQPLTVLTPRMLRITGELDF